MVKLRQGQKCKAGKTHPTPLFLENVNSTAIEQGQMIDIFCDIWVSHGGD